VIFENHSLEDPLKEYVEAIFYFKDFIPDHSIERVVPTGHLFIIFELDGFTRNTFDNKTLEPDRTFTKVWISGMHKNYLSISAHQNSEMFVIQFKPFGSYPFLHLPVEQLNEQVVPANQLLGEEVLVLREQILNAADVKDKFKHAEQWLENRYKETNVPESELLIIFEKLLKSPISDHQQIVESYPKTQKHLISQFKKYGGLTPKVLHRIVRFNEVLQQIHHKQQIAWSQIAYQCGFTDQSHFIKEFKEFSGFNPQEFINRDMHNKETNFFPLDENG